MCIKIAVEHLKSLCKGRISLLILVAAIACRCPLDAQPAGSPSERLTTLAARAPVFQSRSNSEQSATDKSEPSIAGQLAAFLNTKVAEDAFSGVVLVAKSGNPVFEQAYGLSNREKHTPNQLDTKFDLGSMPKMFTAIAIAQLAEAGKLRYDDPIIKYLPDYPDKEIAQEVTIDELLTHTAGFGNYFHPPFFERRIATVKDYLAFVAQDPLVAEPGKQWQYSNSGYVVLGAMVERVAGQDFYDYIRDQIFKPAGMENTGYYRSDEAVENVAVGYTSGPGLIIMRPGQGPPEPEKPQPDTKAPTPPSSGTARKETTPFRPYRGSPAGGAFSTVGDLLNFVNALESHKLVNAASLALIQKGKVNTSFPDQQYGYGFIEWKVGQTRIVGHGGGAPGVNTMLQIYPDLGYTVIVLSNYDPPAAEQVADAARDAILQPLAGQKAPGVASIELRHGVPFVHVMVNGKGPFTFGIDTGMGGEALICPALAGKLPVSGETEVGDPSGRNRQKVPLYLISSLKVAGIEFKDIRATRHEPFPGEENCEGTLGFLLFRDYLFSLDYPHRQLVLSAGSLTADNGRSVIPFTMVGDIPAITIEVANRKVDAHIDSRGMHGLSLPEEFTKGLEFSSKPVVVGRGRTMSGDFEIRGARLAGDIQIAGYTFSRPFVEINPLFPLGNVGSIPLQHFAVTFDQKNKLVRFVSTERNLTIDPPQMPPGPLNGSY